MKSCFSWSKRRKAATPRALGESIFTEADTLPELRTRVQDAVHCHFDEGDMPKVIRLHIVQEEVLAA